MQMDGNDDDDDADDAIVEVVEAAECVWVAVAIRSRWHHITNT